MISAPTHPLKGNELAWEELIDAPFATKQPVEPAIGCIGLIVEVDFVEKKTPVQDWCLENTKCPELFNDPKSLRLKVRASCP